jgi:exopolysaccharide production protein ExoQ
MSFVAAFVICALGVVGLFWLDRDKSVKPSKALWLPVIWLWIIGSRPVASSLQIWTGFGSQSAASGGLDAQLDGSPTDAVVLAFLLAIGVVVLYRRKARTTALLKASAPILIYFLYCLISVTWSPFPGVAFKRWIKAIGDLVMVLVVVTDAHPSDALRRIFSRVGFILFPASILLIRYSVLGRGFDEFGNVTNTGVTTNKNTLGLITFVIAIGVVWNLRVLLRNRKQSNRGRRLWAQVILIVLAVAVFKMANSATSIVCLILGSLLMTVTGMRWVRRRPSRMHTVVLAIASVVAVAMLLGVDETIVHALGRKTDLTGRTEIWKTVIPMARNPIVGSGFESFWNSSSTTLNSFTGVQSRMFKDLVSAHNGYIDVYLNLGWVGVCLMVLILITGYWRASAAFRRDSEMGGLILAYIITAAVYSITEAGFRMLTPNWIFLLFAIVYAGGIASGVVSNAAQTRPRLRSPLQDRILTGAETRKLAEPV